MALYEYECHHCLDHFEVIRHIDKREAPTECPHCHQCGKNLPIISAPSVRFAIPGVKGHYKKTTLELPNA